MASHSQSVTDTGWRICVQLALFIEPHLTGAQRDGIVLDAYRHADDTSSGRRSERRAAVTAKNSFRRGETLLEIVRSLPGKILPARTQVAWQLSTDSSFYAWTLLRIASHWRDRKHNESSNEPLTIRRYLASLIATGMISDENMATPVPMGVAVLEVLQGLTRDQVLSFLEGALPPRRKHVAEKALYGKPKPKASVFELSELSEASYKKAAIACQRLLAKRTDLKIRPAYGRRPLGIDGLVELPEAERNSFWKHLWRRYSPEMPLSHSENATRLHDLESGAGGNRHRALFHVFLCDFCLRAVFQQWGWPQAVYLPPSSEEFNLPPDNNREPRPLSPAELDSQVQRLQVLALERLEQRDRATGRMRVSVDGKPPIDYVAGTRLEPTRSIEIYRGPVVIFWHEIDLPNEFETSLQTTYRIGKYRYVVVESSEGATVVESSPASVKSQVVNRIGIPLTVLAAILAIWTVGHPVGTLGKVRPVGEVPALQNTDTKMLGPSVDRGYVVLSRPQGPEAYFSYSLSVLKNGQPKFACPLKPKLTTQVNKKWLWVFNCGDPWLQLGSVEVDLSLSERRYGLFEKTSQTEKYFKDF